MTYFDILSILGALLLGIVIWLPIYKITISRWVGDSVVKRVESGEIDLNYLLEEGGVFDELSKRVVSRFKMNMLAEMGQLSHQSSAGIDTENPQAMGIQMAKELLQMVGMKNPPAMLQIKTAQALSQMGQNLTGGDSGPLEPPVDLQFNDTEF